MDEMDRMDDTDIHGLTLTSTDEHRRGISDLKFEISNGGRCKKVCKVRKEGRSDLLDL
jgi:hypothetical protein